MAGRTAYHARGPALLFSPGNHHGTDPAHALPSGAGGKPKASLASIIALLGLALTVPDHLRRCAVEAKRWFCLPCVGPTLVRSISSSTALASKPRRRR